MTHRQRAFLNVLYLLLGLWIWTLLFVAQYKPYDDNLAYAFSAFGLSVFVFVIIAVLAMLRKFSISDNYHVTLIFILTCSPVTIGLVIVNYGSLFGKGLD